MSFVPQGGFGGAALAVVGADARRAILLSSALSPTASRDYELWIIPPGKAPMRSKTFTVDASGTATLIVPVPADIGATATAAITDEPTGGVDAPTGKIQLAGKSSG